MGRSISFISLNVEGTRHLDVVRSFILRQKPDIVCFQEFIQSRLEDFKRDIGMNGIFAPLVRLPDDYHRDRGEIAGEAIFSSFPMKNFSVEHYYGTDDIVTLDKKNITASENYRLLKVVISVEKVDYTIATTHFVWTPDGEADEHQRKAVVALLDLARKEESLILCGDFNAPRGKEIFSKIASVYKDNIPLEYDSSIDPDLHRVNGLKHMVDGLFTTPDYKVEDVTLVCGVSDHYAVAAKISRI